MTDTDIEQQKRDNRKKYPVTSEIVDLFTNVFGPVRVKGTTEKPKK